MSITTDRQLNIIRDFHLNHSSFVVDDVLDRDNDLVNIFPVDLLAILEALHHIVNEFLCHFVF